MNSSDNEQLVNVPVNLLDIDVNAIELGKPKPRSFMDPKTKKEITFYNVPLYLRNSDGTRGLLFLRVPRLFCFGINTQTNDNGSATHNVGMALGDRTGTGEETILMKEALDDIKERVAALLSDDGVRTSLKEFDQKKYASKVDMLSLYSQKFGPDGNPCGSPTINASLDEFPASINKKTGVARPEVIVSKFYDGTSVEKTLVNGKKVDRFVAIKPQTIMNTDTEKRFFNAKSILWFEHVYVGTKVSIKKKLKEAVVYPHKSNNDQRGMMELPEDDDIEYIKSTSSDDAPMITPEVNVIDVAQDKAPKEFVTSPKVIVPPIADLINSLPSKTKKTK